MVEKAGAAALSGEGIINPATCRTNQSNGMCCQDLTNATLQLSAKDSLDFTLAGTDCTRPQTQETFAAALGVTGGTGKFANATGAGTATVTIDPEIGNGTISMDAQLK